MLPDLPINVVVRADSSGTSFVFSQHLSADQRGVRARRRRQHDAELAGRHAVEGQRRRDGEHHDHARIDRLTSSTVTRRARRCRWPCSRTRAASSCSRPPRPVRRRSASATLPDDMIVWATDPDVPDAYPIVTYTWLICYKKYADKAKMQAVQDLVKFGLTEGQKDAESLGYIPLPGRCRRQGDAGDSEPDVAVGSAVSSSGATVTHPALSADALFEARPGEIAQAPSRRQVLIDRAFRSVCFAFAALTHRARRVHRPADRVVRRRRRFSDTASASSPAASGIRTRSATASWPRCGARSTRSMLALILGTMFGVAAAVFLSEGFLGLATFAALRRVGLHLNPRVGTSARSPRRPAQEPD